MAKHALSAAAPSFDLASQQPARARLARIGLPWLGEKLAIGPEILPWRVRDEIERSCRALLSSLDRIRSEASATDLYHAAGLERAAGPGSAGQVQVLQVPGIRWDAIARADVVISSGRPRILEINIASHAALFAVYDLLLAAQQPVTGWLRRTGTASAEADQPGIALAAYIGRVLDRHGSELLAIAYPLEELGPDGPYKGFHYAALAELVESAGYAAVCVPYEHLTVDRNGVWAGKRRVGCLYRHFPADFSSPARPVTRLLNAAAEGLVGLITPFLGDLLSAKSLMAYSLRPDLLGLSEGPDDALADCLAPTRIVTGDMWEYLLASKDDLVLKKSLGFGGRHVVIGRDVSVPVWKAKVADAVTKSEVWVVQEFFPPDQAFSARRLPDGAETIDDGAAVYGALLLEGRLVGVVKRQYQGPNGHNVNGGAGALPNPVIWDRGRK